MADQYLDNDQQKDLKKGLYAYLQDKAKRRALETGSDSYQKMQEQFKKQEGLRDAGALVGALSEAGSMVGTVGGKRAGGNIIPALNKELYDSSQGSFQNYAKMRGMEETANMDDLNVARYVSGLEQYDDTNERADAAQQSNMQSADLQREMLRKNLRDKYRLDPRVQSPDKSPVLLDEYGGAKTLPGYKVSQDAGQGPVGSWSDVSGVTGDDGSILVRNTKTGELKKQQLPTGFKKTAPKPVSSQTPADKGASDLAKNFEGDYAKKSQIAAVIEKEVEMFDSLVKSGQVDAAVRHGEGTLKALNSAFGADAVGVEEADRLGGFLQQFKMPWKPGKMVGRDLDLFSQQLRNKANVLRKSSQDSLQRSKALRESGIGGLESVDSPPLTDVDKMSDEQVDAELRKKGLIK